MKFKKNKLYSNFNYTPRYYDEDKINWTLRKKGIESKVLKEKYSYADFINLPSEKKKKNRVRNIVILSAIAGLFFAIPIYYGMGIFQLCTMMFIGSGFIKMSNLLSN